MFKMGSAPSSPCALLGMQESDAVRILPTARTARWEALQPPVLDLCGTILLEVDDGGVVRRVVRRTDGGELIVYK